MIYKGKYMCYNTHGKPAYMKEYTLCEKHRTYITYKPDKGEWITVGVIKECIDIEDMRVVYPVEVWKEQIEKLKAYGEDTSDERIIVDINLDKGYRVMHYRVPCIISERIPSSRRTDIDRILKKKGLKRYNAFEMLARCSGKKPYDKFWLTNECYNCKEALEISKKSMQIVDYKQ